ncbi:MAG: hypothetical protein ABIC40_07745 [bacterium]
MKNNLAVLSIVFMVFVSIMGCSSGSDNPVTPTSGLTTETGSNGKQAQTHLWGYYDVFIDVAARTATAVLGRNAMFAANVVTFLNKPPTNLAFKINKTPVTADYIDVDIDVSIKHPFPNMMQYNGYDVRGIFIGDASGNLKYDSNLGYAVFGSDQCLLDDPDDDDGGGPDGYTRWFNPAEFKVPGLFGYTPGVNATPGYKPSATLNPYKYFADGLGKNDNAFEWLITSISYGVFSSGSTHTRNYYIRFPKTTGIKFGYAVVANWKGTNPITDHPANGPEAMACSAETTESLFYVSPTEWSGDLIVDFDIFSWEYVPSAIYIEANFLKSAHEFDPSSIATGGGDSYSSYHVEIPADNLTSSDGNEYWIICEYDEFDYTTGFSAPNAKLAAFFRNSIFVSDVTYYEPPVCDLVIVTSMPAAGWVWPIKVEFDASGTYDPNPDDVMTYEWDFDGDEIYGESPDDDYIGTEINPTHFYDEEYNGVVNLRVTDSTQLEDICTSDPLEFEITTECESMTMPSGPNSSVTGIGLYGINYHNMEGTRAANPARIICGYEGSNDFCAIGADGGNTVYFHAQNNPIQGIRDMVCTSTDLIIYKDSGTDMSLWTVQYDNTNGFTNMRTSWGPSLPFSNGEIWRVVVDEYDRPVVLAFTPTSTGTWCICHWNGSDWDIINLPQEIKTAAFSISYLLDFDYDPTTGYYLFVEQLGAPGIYVMDKTGTLVWYDPDIWPGLVSIWSVGIDIPIDDPECHILVMAGNYSIGDQPVYWARYNPFGGQKTTAMTPSGPNSLRNGRGTLVKHDSQWRWFSAVQSERWGYMNIPF